MKKNIFKNLLLFIFLTSLFGLASNLLYNQDKKINPIKIKEVSAQAGILGEEEMFCETEIPIGEIIDETEDFSQEIIDNLKNILNSGNLEIIEARKLIDYTSDKDGINDDDYCGAGNCFSSITNTKYTYCCDYIDSWSCSSCDECEEEDEGGGEGGAFNISPGKFFKGLFLDVFAANSSGCWIENDTEPKNTCDCGGGDCSANYTNYDSHCYDCDCTTCSSTFGIGKGSACPLNKINPIMNISKSGSINYQYQEIFKSYKKIEELITKEPAKLLGKLDYSRKEFKKCTVTKDEYFEVLSGEKPGESTFTCESINYLRKQGITVEISGKDDCYRNNYYCCK